jgi:osmotically-inducible protein OsmY
MVRLLFVVGAGAVVAFIGCRAADTAATPERRPDLTIHAKSVTTASATILVPENPADTNIRRDLNLAIAGDTDLRNRLISFIVTNGDVSVTGTVRTEQERRKINDLAMNIGGVKSVANALLVAE